MPKIKKESDDRNAIQSFIKHFIALGDASTAL